MTTVAGGRRARSRSTPEGGRAPTARGQEKREQILEVALRHFAKSGYRGVSTASIADDVGITDPGLLHHFGSKSGLLMALLESRYGYDDQILMSERHETGREVLDRLGELVAENTENEVDVRLRSVILAESVAPAHPSHEFFAQRFRRARGVIRDQLADAQARGLVRADVDVAGLAAALLAVMDGLQYQWLVDPELDMAASFQAMAALVGAAMTTDPHEKES